MPAQTPKSLHNHGQVADDCLNKGTEKAGEASARTGEAGGTSIGREMKKKRSFHVPEHLSYSMERWLKQHPDEDSLSLNFKYHILGDDKPGSSVKGQEVQVPEGTDIRLPCGSGAASKETQYSVVVKTEK